MSDALKQAWWAPVAGLLVLGQLAMAFLFGWSEDTESTIVGIAIALTGAIVLGAGLWKRPQARGLGNVLILVGAGFAAFWFWTLFMPILAIIVAVGLVTSEVRSRAPAAEVP
ncbi:MAG TPA: hypothetical protein VMQ81_12200 [Acidimicrobiia bacterium]|nr:hypothetical protein [Acidimicrobiia bacterium]